MSKGVALRILILVLLSVAKVEATQNRNFK